MDVETSTPSLSISFADDPVKTSANPMDCQNGDVNTDERFNKLIRDWLTTVPRRNQMTSARCGEFTVLCRSCNLG